MDRDQKNNIPENRPDPLDRLIRQAGRRLDSEIDRPSDDSILAVLTDSATASQREEVANALDQSATFRREFKALAMDFERLSDEKTVGRFADADCSIPDPVQKKISGLTERRPSSLALPRVIVPFIAAVAMLVLIVLTLIPSEPEWNLVQNAVGQNQVFGLGGTRSGHDSVYQTAEEAALGAMRAALVIPDGHPAPGATNPAVEPPGDYTTISLAFSYPHANQLLTYTGFVPVGIDYSHEAHFFVLALPSRDLFSLPINDKLMSAEWDRAPSDVLCVALVYHSSDGYKFSAPRVFQPE